MAQPPRKPDHTLAPRGVRGADQVSALRAGRSAKGPVQVRTHAVGQVVVLEVAGPLSDVIEELDRAIELALADGPRGVVCDLSGVPEGAEPGTLVMLAAAGRHVRNWPGIPVAVASPDPQVRTALRAAPCGGHLIVTTSVLSAVSEVRRAPAPTVQWLRLAPHPAAPRASRNFVTRSLLDWGLGRVISPACLVVSELVTNSTMYAGTDIDLSIAWSLGALRLTVRDNSPSWPHQLHPGLQTHGRGLTIVTALSRAFGALPTADGGKVVWAVLEAPATPLVQPTPSWPGGHRLGVAGLRSLAAPGRCLRDTDLGPAPIRPTSSAYRS